MRLHRWMPAAGFAITAAICSAASPPVNSSTWLSNTVSILQTGSALSQQSARAELIHASEMASMPPDYPAALNAALLPVLGSGTPRARLNAAVVLERVAKRTASPALVPATSALLCDRSEAIVLWGIKTARPLISAGGAPASALARKVVNALKAHLGSGPIAEEAYEALHPDGTPQPAVVQSLLAALEARTALYDNGGSPSSPTAEASIPVYLSVTCWPSVDAVTQDRILTDLGNLGVAIGRAVANGNTDRAVLEMSRFIASALINIGTQSNDDALISAAKSLQEIESANPGAIAPRLVTLQAALHARGISLHTPA